MLRGPRPLGRFFHRMCRGAGEQEPYVPNIAAKRRASQERSPHAPQVCVADTELFLELSDLAAKAMGVCWITGRGTEAGKASAPKFVERAHRQLAQILRRHGRYGAREMPFALHYEAKFELASRRAKA